MSIANKENKIQFIKDVVKANARISYSGTSSGMVALAAAKASSILKSKVFYTTVFVSPFIYLNSAHIGIPNLGRCGLQKVVAAGLVLKNPQEGLHILQNINMKTIKEINKMVEKPTLINVEIQYNTKPIYVRVIAVDDKANVADVVIENNPTDFKSVKFNNKDSSKVLEGKKDGTYIDATTETIDYVTAEEAYALMKDIKISEIQWIEEHIKTNEKICYEGMRSNDLSTIHHHYNEAISYLSQPEHGFNKYFWATEILDIVTAGIDARMGGCPLPTITSATNGDHGIVAVVAPLLYGRRFNLPKEKIYQAILLSHFITWKISLNIGKLCIMCGTAVAAVAGAITGIAYLQNMPWKQVKDMLNMHLAQQAGTICYGSSPSCAFQVICAIEAGLSCLSLARHGGKVPHKDGIVNDDFEKTLHNLKHFTLATRDETVNSIVATYQKKITKKGSK